ncbi:DUF58 domain-containing protein [Granulosicoccus antarcticus]|uniref:VWFA domain-containing protein n=1 Tax=Granulosicoccus antarcticus IMCC3135 TaxID=1192854 RepID=A0A2Z2P4I5_9GAMM|nr:DUF58 domain-containing protein [Granulosicoccus antarcticus]ASJ74744.1 hypothetical protein IMCC3135_23375 [Granulosicoccus antarcticus IMCC3135]
MAGKTANRLLKPDVLARLGSLELIARTVVDGVTTGLHRSPHFGFSQEFAEYRAYNEGDDLRYVDWNVYARTDRTYIKRFQGETNTAVTLLLDASASMDFGTPVSKLQQAQYLIASLAYLTRKQHDALGLAIFDETVRHYLAPSARPDSLMQVISQLEHTVAGAGTNIIEALGSLQASMTRRGLVIVVSDLYADADQLLEALRPLAHHGQDVAVFHVLDKEEVQPSLSRISALRDLESDETVIVDPAFLKTDYRTRFNAHCESVAQACRRIGADYTQVLTTEPLDAALQGYLRFRERRGR